MTNKKKIMDSGNNCIFKDDSSYFKSPAICISIDTDWAPDGLIRYVISKLGIVLNYTI
jgi:hypothetical protein